MSVVFLEQDKQMKNSKKLEEHAPLLPRPLSSGQAEWKGTKVREIETCVYFRIGAKRKLHTSEASQHALKIHASGWSLPPEKATTNMHVHPPIPNKKQYMYKKHPPCSVSIKRYTSTHK